MFGGEEREKEREAYEAALKKTPEQCGPSLLAELSHEPGVCQERD